MLTPTLLSCARLGRFIYSRKWKDTQPIQSKIVSMSWHANRCNYCWNQRWAEEMWYGAPDWIQAPRKEGGAQIVKITRGLFFFKILLIYSWKTQKERGRDIGRGGSRLHAGGLMWDSIPYFRITLWVEGMGSTAEPPRCPSGIVLMWFWLDMLALQLIFPLDITLLLPLIAPTIYWTITPCQSAFSCLISRTILGGRYLIILALSGNI